MSVVQNGTGQGRRATRGEEGADTPGGVEAYGLLTARLPMVPICGTSGP
jgi:hypothetical protein